MRFLTCVVVVSGAFVAAADASEGRTAATNLACATQIVSSWTTAQLANETIAIPVEATNVGGLAPAARAGYGGVLLFGATAPASMPGILATLQRERPDHYAWMVMTDEEGGGVERLTNVVGSFPWAQTMGKNLGRAQIRAIGRRVGTALLAAGVNTDLAPVLDVDGRAQAPGATNPDGYRSFSGVSSIAANDGSSFMWGLQDAGVTAVVKHFPGLGYSTGNTDYGPAATLSWAKLQSTGLPPFLEAIANGATAVMLSNARIPGLTPLPASLSPVVVKYLRTTLEFKGLLVTDSLSAGAISALHLSVPAASVVALATGDDLILFGSPTSLAASLTLAGQISNAIVNAVTQGTLSKSSLIAAAAQDLAVRNQLTCSPTTTTT
ncbi:MAG: glycoside hydrolase family 3 N-terminal domain-containing protein [Acidimicrobiales bacterium]|jgi:beta-N-acetylhexosaminidase